MHKKFTARFVENVTTPKDRDDYHDTDEKGLMLRVSRDGTKTWSFRYRRKSDSKRRFVSLGHFPGMSLEAARTAAGKARTAVREGEDPASGVQERKVAPTFCVVATDWQQAHAVMNRSARVRVDDQSMLTRYILPAIGHMKARDIGRHHLSLMIVGAQGAKDGRKGHTKKGQPVRKLTHRPNRVFELTRAILRWALQQGIIATDPTAGMVRPIKKEAPRDRALSADEIKTFWQNVDKLPASPALHITLRLALVTGQRIGEVCGIAKSELTLEGPTPVWVIPSKRTKNGEGARVPLAPLAVSLIREALALQKPRDGDDGMAFESPYLFPARAKRDRSHGPILGAATAAALFRGRDKIGLADFRIHDLRRTAATGMAELGINPHTISLILNHVSASRSTVTGKVYVQYAYDKEKREALEKWGSQLQTIAAGYQKVDTNAQQETAA